MKIIGIFILTALLLGLQSCSSFNGTPEDDKKARCQALAYQKVQDTLRVGADTNDGSNVIGPQSAQAAKAAQESDQLGCE